MPPKTCQVHTTRGARDNEVAGDGGQFFRLLRCSHIFASAVNEILDGALLQEASSLALSPSQFHALRLMAADGHHQVGEIADLLGVSPPAVTKTIDKLERLGLVARTPSKGDRRATLLTVSRKGHRLVRKYEEIRAARLSPVLAGFGPKEIARFTDLLERFAVSLLDLEQPRQRSCLRCAAHIVEGCPVGQLQGGCPYHGGRTGRARGDGHQAAERADD